MLICGCDHIVELQIVLIEDQELSDAVRPVSAAKGYHSDRNNEFIRLEDGWDFQHTGEGGFLDKISAETVVNDDSAQGEISLRPSVWRDFNKTGQDFAWLN